MKKRSLISAILAGVMTVSMMSFTAFAAENDSVNPEIDGKTISVDTVDELKWLSDYSYRSEADETGIPVNFAGYTVKITADIGNVGSFKPIKEFNGNMEGAVEGKEYATISGLIVNETSGGAGLCAKSANGTFTKLIIADSTIHTNDANAGAFAGNGFTSSFNDCKAINVEITGKRFVGGITGYCYGNITNCEVTADEGKTSVVSANTPGTSLISSSGDNIGGIVGYMGEGRMKVSGCTVSNATIEGSRQVGGISGFENYGNTIEFCTVTKSAVSSLGTGIIYSNRTPNVGGIVGQFNQGTSTQWLTVTNNTLEDVTISQARSGKSYIGWAVGDSHYTQNSNYYVVSDNTQKNVTLTLAGSAAAFEEIGNKVENLKTDN